jgi:uncharacterized protein involved in exopolysaccharide biosynthesis
MRADMDFDRANIDLVAIGRVIWRGRLVVLCCTLLVGGAALAYALLASRWYRADVVLIQTDTKGGLRGLGSIAGLASLAGISLPTGGQSQAPLARLRSRELLAGFIQEHQLLPVLFADDWDAAAGKWKTTGKQDVPEIRDALELFNAKIRSVAEDRRTGIVTLSISWRDPQLASEWANGLVSRANREAREQALKESERNIEYLRAEMAQTNLPTMQQAIGRVLESEMQQLILARGSEEFAFKVVDPAIVPKKPFKPRRKVMLFLGILLGGSFGALIACLRNIEQLRMREGDKP